MYPFLILRRSDGHRLGWGDYDPDADTVAVAGVGVTVDRAALHAVAGDSMVALVWPDGPPPSGP